jgi:pSer/pThr/pTyr-binding forkhead associated (FHA) protein
MQLDATFCGQCGHNLKSAESKLPPPQQPLAVAEIEPLPAANNVELPPTILTEPAADLWSEPSAPIATPTGEPSAPPSIEPAESVTPAIALVPDVPPAPTPEPPPAIVEQPSVSRQLLHLQTNTILEISPDLQVIHLGKPNETIAPDIDISKFPCAEVVSRIHASIQLEDDNYYIEDSGSANGTYINHNVLAKGNRHLLRDGDRIGLGKGDLVTLIFQTPSA